MTLPWIPNLLILTFLSILKAAGPSTIDDAFIDDVRRIYESTSSSRRRIYLWQKFGLNNLFFNFPLAMRDRDNFSMVSFGLRITINGEFRSPKYISHSETSIFCE